MSRCGHADPVLFGEVGLREVVPASFIREGQRPDQDTFHHATIYQCTACGTALVVTTLLLPDGQQLVSPATELVGAR